MSEPIRSHTAAEHADALRGVAPRGRIWDRVTGTRWTALLDVLAAGFKREQDRDVAIIGEAIPGTPIAGTVNYYPSETLAAWESEFGLSGVGLSVSQRRTQLIGHLRAKGGNSEAYFVALAAGLGVTVTITRHWPWTCAKPPCYPLYATSQAFVWTVVGPAATDATTRAMVEALIDLHAPGTDLVLYSWTA